MAASAASPETTILSKLESLSSSTSSDSADIIFSLFSDYLRPFPDLTKPIPKKNSQQQTLIRSLAKQYLPFLNRSLSLLPKLLSSPRPDQSHLFKTYELCLRCLDYLSSQLSCKPYSIHIQRLRLIHCFEACGLCADAWNEGFRVLESLRGIDFDGKEKARARKKGTLLLPNAENAGGKDREFAVLVVEIVVIILKCAASGQIKNSGEYERVLRVVKEVRPWFRELDETAYVKLHRVLVNCLSKCTQYVASEATYFDGDLVLLLCREIFSEHVKSSLQDQLFKFTRRICSLLSTSEERHSLVVDVICSLLEAVAPDGKVQEDLELELIDLVYYCVSKFRSASVKFSCSLAAAINKIAGQKVGMPVDLILKLYAFGLNIVHWNREPRDNGLITSTNAESGSPIRNLLAIGDQLNGLPALLASLNGYFEIECTETYLSSNDGWKNFHCQTYSRSDCGREISHTKECNPYLQSYLSAIEFLCQPLGDLVNLERKHLFAEPEICQAFVQLPIQDVFSQYSDVYLHSITHEHEKKLLEENNKVVLCVSVAALTLSFMSKLNMQKSKHFIEHIIGRNVQPEGLKFLHASLHNLGVILHRNKLLQEASEALELSCLASWTCLRNLCQMFSDNGGLGDMSENAILDLFGDVCTRSAFHLDVLHQCGSEKIEKALLRNLDYWFTAKSFFDGLPGPTALVKQWVKMQCKKDKGMHRGKALHELLSLKKISQGALDIILEQELLMYEEMHLFNPKFCHKMQMMIIDTLIQHADVTLDNDLQIARLWINKGRIQRADRSHGLNGCIQCFSRAISSIDKANIKSSLPVCHQLAIAHCLRALCTMEAEPKSKRIFEDLSDALNLWMNAFTSVGIHVEEMEMGDLFPDIPLPLVYHVIDLLSLKGSTSCQENFLKLILRFFTWKKIPVEKSLAHLWKCRRMSHSLCYSPISEALATIFLEHYGDVSKSMDFWVDCLRESQSSLIGLQQSFFFLFADAHQGPSNSAIFSRQYINIEEVKQVALELVSNVSVPKDSNFIAAFLYYGLCEQMASYGHLHEALLFAKESHRLRSELFQQYFTYSIEQQADKYSETEQCIQKRTYCIKNLQVAGPVANEVWFGDSKPLNLESCHLSPWNVIQCYLESSLQVGTIHELLGNGTDAETFLLWGKDISCSFDLPHFVVSFSSILGKIYHKRQLWELARAELETAKQLLMDTGREISCFKCRLVLEVNVDLQLGDLFRSQFYDCMDENAADKLLEAEELYKLAIGKLNFSKGKATPQDACGGILIVPNTKVEVSRGRMAMNAKKIVQRNHLNIPDQNKIVTRSMRRSAGQKMCSSQDALASSKTVLSGNKCDNTKVVEPFSQMEYPRGGLESKDECMCNEMGCWRCHFLDIINSKLLSSFIQMKWEFIQRRLLLRSFINLGKCLVERGQIHDAHGMFWKSISNLFSIFSRNPSGPSVSIRFLLDLIGKEITNDAFVIERATVLYNICWFSLKSYGQNKRTKCCEFSHIQLSEIVSCLKLAFRLCNEVPMLRQKVSRLLAVIYVLSTSKEPFSSLTLGTFSANYWAMYFHQASLGSHVNSFFSLNMVQKSKAQTAIDTQGFHVAGSPKSSPESKADMGNIFKARLVPESVEDLEGFLKSFFMDTPCASIVCISVLSGADACLLRGLVIYPSFIRAWMLLSRLNSKCQPIVILIPLLPILEDDDTNANCENIANEAHQGKHWHCPWTSSVINDVVPAFKMILEENYISSSVYPLEDTKEARLSWWTRRKNLDLRLGKLLRKLEDLWLGSWKCLFLGGLINCPSIDLLCKKLVLDLKSKCKLDVDEELVSLILRSARSAMDLEASLPLLQLRSGCYIGNFDMCSDKRVGMQSLTSNRTFDASKLALQLVLEAADQLNIDDKLFSEPIILVLDGEVQMLPWENLPILRSQEVYRVPSFDSISMILDRKVHSYIGKQVRSTLSTYPSIDPLDAFYLLNPSGDLKNTQVEFESWFRDKKLEGKAGSAPASEELALALKSHDLFMYFGHGSGVQYITRHEIQKLDSCAATLLMGCSSGSLSLNGSYVPEGACLSYLLAGSPVIVANLWEVTDKDIDRFARAMLDAWIIERSSLVECFRCNSLAKQLEAMEIENCKSNANTASSKNFLESCDRSFLDVCPHRNKIGSFMAQAREACTLPFLTGASPVCYGVPTCIIRKKDL